MEARGSGVLQGPGASAGSLYKLGDDYFVEDGNHRISVARYHEPPDVEADVTELRPISTRPVGRFSARSGFAFACQHAA